MKNFQVIILMCIFFLKTINCFFWHVPKVSFKCTPCDYKKVAEQCLEHIRQINATGYEYAIKQNNTVKHNPGKKPVGWNADYQQCIPEEYAVDVKPIKLCFWSPKIGCKLLGITNDKNPGERCADICAYTNLCPCGNLKKSISSSSRILATLLHLFLVIFVLTLSV